MSLQEWEKFYLINTWAIEEHVIAWSYKQGEKRFYMFLPHGRVHNIWEEQVYASKEEAEKAFIKRLEDSAQKNLDLAEKIKKEWMTCTVIEQESEKTWLKK